MIEPIAWDRVDGEHVRAAIREFDLAGPKAFFAEHGFAPTTTYDLVVGGNLYPPKAILGRAYELATGRRLASTEFEGGRGGAVTVLERLGFDIRPRRR
jgi:hypothetical protein